jgi:hypothetical protein
MSLEYAEHIQMLEEQVRILTEERDRLAVENGRLQRATEHPGLAVAVHESLKANQDAATAMEIFCKRVKREYLTQYRATATVTVKTIETYAAALRVGDDELARAIVEGDDSVAELERRRKAAANGSND